VLLGADGRPIINLPPDWDGITAQRLAIPSDAESGPMYTGMPVVLVSSSGSGKRWYRCGIYERELQTGPYIDTYSALYERDYAKWKGQPGKCIGVRIPPTATRRLMPEAAAHFDLSTKHNVVDPQLASIVRKLAGEMQGGFVNGRMYAEGLSLALLGLLATHHAAKPSQVPKTPPFSELNKRRILEFVDENMGTDLGVVQLAALVHMSPDHFARVFKSSFGVSPHRFLMQRRVDRASTVLRQMPDRPISDVAVGFGFVSQAHFTDVFRKITGVTPGRWRRSFRSSAW